MYESQTYEAILDRILSKVSTDVDKREGSVIMNAVAPVAMELANVYILLDSILQNGYVDTSNIREYVVYRCTERGITPQYATSAVLKGKFNEEIPIGSRFSLDELNYVATEFIEGKEESYFYQLKCESTGVEGNKHFGELSPIEYISKDLSGELVELLIPAEDDEDIDSLKKRYLGSFSSTAFGGNVKDYTEKVNALDGVGGCVVVPTWNGGGTVKIIIIDSDYNKASGALVENVQEAIDPTDSQGNGIGLAPIGHTVTVVTVENVTVNISMRITFVEGYSWSRIKDEVTDTLQAYFLELRKAWENDPVVVRISQVENRILNLDGVLDIADTKINGVADNLPLSNDEIPVLGEVVNNG